MKITWQKLKDKINEHSLETEHCIENGLQKESIDMEGNVVNAKTVINTRYFIRLKIADWATDDFGNPYCCVIDIIEPPSPDQSNWEVSFLAQSTVIDMDLS